MRPGVYSYIICISFLLQLLSCTPVSIEDECEGWISPIASTKVYVAPAGNQLSFSYKTDSDVRYYISKGDDWLAISDASQGDTCSVSVTIPANTGQNRVGRLTVETLSGCSHVEFNIFQYGNDTGDPERQRKALVDLYHATDGDNWKDNTNWCTDKPLSEWYGLQFDSNGELRSVHLQHNGLKGELPSSIGDLANLDLYLFRNELYGEIPSGAFAARYLYLDENEFTSIQEPDSPEDYPILYISIASNSLSGPLPEALGRFPVLQSLKLTDNDYTGQIPQSYSSVYPYLELGGNALSGRIPQAILESRYFPDYWPVLLCQRGPGFDLDGIRLPLQMSATPDEREEISEYFLKNKFTILFPTNSSDIDSEVLATVGEWYEGYHDCGLGVCVYISWNDKIEFLDKYPWYQAALPMYSRYFKKYAPKTVLLVDNEGYLVTNPFTDGLDKVKSLLEAEFGEFQTETHENMIQKASVGRGIDLVFLGDAFTAKMIDDGLFDQAVNKAVEAFFSVAPMSDFKDHFNIYSLAVPSVSSSYSPGSITALDCWYGDGTTVGGNDSKCRDYTVSLVSKGRIDDAVTIVLMNSERYAGTSYLYPPSSGQYGRGWAVSYIPLCYDPDDFTFLIRHEAIGHSFAKLADENLIEANGEIPSSLISDIKAKEKYGWWSNVDFTADPSAVKWAPFISDERYASERVGVYKGGWGYWTGIWTPTWRSIMKGNSDEFNAPSREAIWKRVMSLSNGPGWTPTYEAFVEYDLGITEQ